MYTYICIGICVGVVLINLRVMRERSSIEDPDIIIIIIIIIISICNHTHSSPIWE